MNIKIKRPIVTEFNIKSLIIHALLSLFFFNSANAQEISRFYIKNIDKTLDKASLVISEGSNRTRAYNDSMLKGIPNNLVLYSNNTYEFIEIEYGISRVVSKGSWRKDEEDIFIENEGGEIRVIDNGVELMISLFENDSNEVFVYFDREKDNSHPVEPSKEMPYIGTYVSYSPEITVYKFNQDGTFIFSTKTGILQNNVVGQYTYSHENGVERISVKSNSLKGSAIVSMIDDKTDNDAISIAWKIDNYYKRIFHKSPDWVGAIDPADKPRDNPLQGAWYYSKNKSDLMKREYFLIDKNGNRFVNEKGIDGKGYSFYPDGKAYADYSSIPYQIKFVDFRGSTTKGIFEFITEDTIKMEIFEAGNPPSDSFSLNFKYYYRATKDNTDLPCKEVAANIQMENYDLLMELKNINLGDKARNLISNTLEQQKTLSQYNKSQRAANRPEVKYLGDEEYKRKRANKILVEAKDYIELNRIAYTAKAVGAFEKVELVHQVYSSLIDTFNIYKKWGSVSDSHNNQIQNIVIPQLDIETAAEICSTNPLSIPVCLGGSGFSSLKYFLEALAFEHSQMANDVLLYKAEMEKFIDVAWQRGYRSARHGNDSDLKDFQIIADNQSKVMSGWVLRLICFFQEASDFSYECNNPTLPRHFNNLLSFEALKDEFVFGYDEDIEKIEGIYNAHFGVGLKPYEQLTPILSSKFIDIYNSGWSRGIEHNQLELDAKSLLFKGHFNSIDTGLYEAELILDQLEKNIICTAL